MAPARRARVEFCNFSRELCIARTGRTHAGWTVYPPWIQIADIAIAGSQSCDRKSKFGLRHAKNSIALWRDEVKMQIIYQ